MGGSTVCFSSLVVNKDKCYQGLPSKAFGSSTRIHVFLQKHTSTLSVSVSLSLSLSLSHINTHSIKDTKAEGRLCCVFEVSQAKAVREDLFWTVPKQTQIFLPGRCQGRDCTAGWGDLWKALLSFVKISLGKKNKVRGIQKQGRPVFSRRKWWKSLYIFIQGGNPVSFNHQRALADV